MEEIRSLGLYILALLHTLVAYVQSEHLSTDPNTNIMDVTGFEKSTTLLPCLASDDKQFPFKFWIFPNGSTMREYEGPDERKNEINVINGTLTLHQVSRVIDEGVYVCVAGEIERRASFVRLNVKTNPESITIWENHKSRVVTGVIAAGIAGALIVLPCLVYKHRWKPKKSNDSQNLDQVCENDSVIDIRM
ncbi:uncharacterized protein LOC143237316 [Tachypleus tridentatus]|uniref:uncharacterized protein LOC143237316 n=1 Tax=Tachypleus tridentatus TaxID=6853 RepID=UPI003FCFB418